MSGERRATLSFSRLAKLAKCPQDYYRSYEDPDPSMELESGAGLAGTAIHRTIAQAEREGWWRDSDRYAIDDPEAPLTATFRDLFTKLVEEAGGPDAPRIHWGGRKRRDFPYGETFPWWLHEGPTMLRRYGSIRRRDEAQGAVIEQGWVEMRVRVEIGEELMEGWIDAALLINPDGQRVIRDWKSGTWLDPWQLATYGWLAEEALGWSVPVGEFGYLRGTKAEDWIKPYDLTLWTPLARERYRQLGAQLEAHRQARAWPWNPSNLCPSCKQRLRCPWGKTLQENGKEKSRGPSEAA